MKVLNLYAGIGGNRKLWENVEVTAVEYDKEIAEIYKRLYPNDTVIVADAHKYLEQHFEEFDFIWASPPCPSHSRIRNVAGVGRGQNKPIYPDMRLYEEIIFLQQVTATSGTKFRGNWIVENVKSYYKPLIKPYEIGRHYVWSNFFIPKRAFESKIQGTNEELRKINQVEGVNDRKILRNCTEAEIGQYILEQALSKQATLCMKE